MVKSIAQLSKEQQAVPPSLGEADVVLAPSAGPSETKSWKPGSSLCVWTYVWFPHYVVLGSRPTKGLSPLWKAFSLAVSVPALLPPLPGPRSWTTSTVVQSELQRGGLPGV